MRLPTEAQWEYACRAVTTTPYSFEHVENECALDVCEDEARCESHRAFAWHCGTDPDRPNVSHPVGVLQPNAWGFHDMHGNVSEWCEDLFEDTFYGREEAQGPDPVNGPVPIPFVASEYGDGQRVARGGDYRQAALCRSATRLRGANNYRHRSTGVRLATRLVE